MAAESAFGPFRKRQKYNGIGQSLIEKCSSSDEEDQPRKEASSGERVREECLVAKSHTRPGSGAHALLKFSKFSNVDLLMISFL